MIKKTKKGKKVYPVTKTIMCPRCKSTTNHTLFDAEKGIYKCLICKTVHA